VQSIKSRFPQAELTAVGTNALATQAMHKAGADKAATGENAVAVNCRRADVIIGPVGIVIADSLWGEVSPAIALAVAQSEAVRILLPMNLCSNYIAGIGKQPLSTLIEDALNKIAELM
jgi:hypothetical protein